MNPKEYETFDRLADEAIELFDNHHKKGEFKMLEASMKKACQNVDQKYSVVYRVVVEVFDQSKEKSIVLGGSGINCHGGGTPHPVNEGDAPESYIVDGHVVRLPAAYCPKCWSDWHFKFKHKSCPSCDATMGMNVKLLLDTGTCPYCGEGKVSRNNPTCSKCNHKVTDSEVHWG